MELQMSNETFVGGNDDAYTGNGKIWEIAERSNRLIPRDEEGRPTIRRRRVVKSYRRVGVL